MKRALVAFLAFGALFWSVIAAPVQAMCIYSHIDRILEVDLAWRWSQTRWKIKSGDHKCTQGEGGPVQIRIRDHADYVVSSGDDVDFNVDDHGWVSVQVIKRASNGHPSEWKFENKNKHGHVKETEKRKFECPWSPCPRPGS